MALRAFGRAKGCGEGTKVNIITGDAPCFPVASCTQSSLIWVTLNFVPKGNLCKPQSETQRRVEIVIVIQVGIVREVTFLWVSCTNNATEYFEIFMKIGFSV